MMQLKLKKGYRMAVNATESTNIQKLIASMFNLGLTADLNESVESIY